MRISKFQNICKKNRKTENAAECDVIVCDFFRLSTVMVTLAQAAATATWCHGVQPFAIIAFPRRTESYPNGLKFDKMNH